MKSQLKAKCDQFKIDAVAAYDQKQYQQAINIYKDFFEFLDKEKQNSQDEHLQIKICVEQSEVLRDIAGCYLLMARLNSDSPQEQEYLTLAVGFSNKAIDCLPMFFKNKSIETANKDAHLTRAFSQYNLAIYLWNQYIGIKNKKVSLLPILENANLSMEHYFTFYQDYRTEPGTVEIELKLPRKKEAEELSQEIIVALASEYEKCGDISFAKADKHKLKGLSNIELLNQAKLHYEKSLQYYEALISPSYKNTKEDIVRSLLYVLEKLMDDSKEAHQKSIFANQMLTLIEIYFSQIRKTGEVYIEISDYKEKASHVSKNVLNENNENIFRGIDLNAIEDEEELISLAPSEESAMQCEEEINSNLKNISQRNSNAATDVEVAISLVGTTREPTAQTESRVEDNLTNKRKNSNDQSINKNIVPFGAVVESDEEPPIRLVKKSKVANSHYQEESFSQTFSKVVTAIGSESISTAQFQKSQSFSNSDKEGGFNIKTSQVFVSHSRTNRSTEQNESLMIVDSRTANLPSPFNPVTTNSVRQEAAARSSVTEIVQPKEVKLKGILKQTDVVKPKKKIRFYEQAYIGQLKSNEKEFLNDLFPKQTNNNPSPPKIKSSKSTEEATQFSNKRSELIKSAHDEQRVVFPDIDTRSKVIEVFRDIFHEQLKDKDIIIDKGKSNKDALEEEKLIFKAGLIRCIASFHRDVFPNSEKNDLRDKYGIFHIKAQRSFLRAARGMVDNAYEALMHHYTSYLLKENMNESSQAKYEIQCATIKKAMHVFKEKCSIIDIQKMFIPDDINRYSYEIYKTYEIANGKNLLERTLGLIMDDYLLEIEDVFNEQGDMSKFLIDLLTKLKNECLSGEINRVWNQQEVMPDNHSAEVLENGIVKILLLFVQAMIDTPLDKGVVEVEEAAPLFRI